MNPNMFFGTKKPKIWYLKNLGLFHNTPDDFLDALNRATVMQQFDEGDLVFTPKEASEKVYIVKRGKVQVYQVSPDGKKYTFDILGPGDIFGDITNANGKRRAPEHFAQAQSDCYVCIATKQEFLTVIKMWPDVAVRVMQDIGGKLQHAEQQIRDLVFHTAIISVLNALIRYAVKHGEVTERHFVIRDRLTHEQIASLIGSTRETVTRAFSILKQKGFVTVNGDGIMIDKEKIDDPL